jgi:hypothetical protein
VQFLIRWKRSMELAAGKKVHCNPFVFYGSSH